MTDKHFVHRKKDTKTFIQPRIKIVKSLCPQVKNSMLGIAKALPIQIFSQALVASEFPDHSSSLEQSWTGCRMQAAPWAGLSFPFFS